MVILEFLLQITAATLFLLFGVRMVQGGIERAYGNRFRRLLSQSGLPLRTTSTGFALAILLQSSAAVSLLASSFVSTGIVTFAAALAVVLGADLGSAFLVGALSFSGEAILPLILVLGGVLHLKSGRERLKNLGSVLLGVGVILIALEFLRGAVEPVRDSAFLPAVAGYLAVDVVTGFITGAVLAFVMHSSVAAILMCVALVSTGALPLAAGIPLVLGANFGSALVPVWLSRDMDAPARRVPLANLVLRGTWAVVAAFLLARVSLEALMPGAAPTALLIGLHISFNAALLLVVPFTARLEPLAARLLSDAELEREDVLLRRSALDLASLPHPGMAQACLRREVLRMLQIVEAQCLPVIDMMRSTTAEASAKLIKRDRHINDAMDAVRSFVAQMSKDDLPKDERKRARELAQYAIGLEAAGDIIVQRLVPRADQMEEENIRLSNEGYAELREIHEAILANIALASTLLIADDVDTARLLINGKAEVAKLERKSSKSHLKRLTKGRASSIVSSDIHLEALKALKDINSQVASLAYPILAREGHLLASRLVEEPADADLPDPIPPQRS
ncbi:Na/Pi cotransporter family protein [Tranquillimonas alkanivorans]|uniref:Phosphate:Na+ symporter n=1 Tax=Tranquillimonas alkanivorans TaxID=441119 RepID=A0A1I5Q311_9RHOB|nr:Na/Pi cotransporter family protein [Tranquillimonas alkanivorans]SFP40400.1 phosphate:Na+ symporter [Tranquillimonas alkanivorans]